MVIYINDNKKYRSKGILYGGKYINELKSTVVKVFCMVKVYRLIKKYRGKGKL